MTETKLRFRGLLAALGADDQRALMNRSVEGGDLVHDLAAAIIDTVRHEGDSALRSLAREYDGARLTELEIPIARCADALAALEPELRLAMERAARNIATVHTAMLPVATVVEPEPGIVVTRKPEPYARIGVYAPGGKAAYPSSVLMCAVPARVAGVGEIIVCTPSDSSGAPSRFVLAACALAKVDRVFAVGGAGAIAAMAYGTESVPRVDRIVGPGNAYVAAAKLLVAPIVGIDSPAGPSELLILADDTCDAAMVAREMIAQAEHDEAACVVAIVLSSDVAARIETSLLAQAAATSRKTIVRTALERSGGIVVADSADQAVSFASAYAAEHVLIVMRDADQIAARLRACGTVCIGHASSVTFGDYVTGANHVLPTGGLARSYSGLSTHDFVRWTTTQSVTPAAAASMATDVAAFASAEGLDAHARAAAAFKPTKP